jgi:hypothetical protein
MYTQEQYDALVAAIAQGALKVEYGDKKFEYRNLSDMLRVKAEMAAELGLSGDADNKVRRPSFSKGLWPENCSTR